MKPVYDNTYWLTKQERKRLAEPKPERPNMFNRIMTAFFSRDTKDEEREKKHTRSRKQRLIRRQKHRARMRNAV